MTPETYLALLTRAGRLKTALRHCWLDARRKESVADHSWRMALMALLLAHVPEFSQVDLDRVIHLCLIHDLGEAFTGDIPTFQKGRADREEENRIYQDWLQTFPEEDRKEWEALLSEWESQTSKEAQVARALDKLEAVISHNESDIRTWLPLEHSLQFTYPEKAVSFSPWLKALKQLVDQWTRQKEKDAGFCV